MIPRLVFVCALLLSTTSAIGAGKAVASKLLASAETLIKSKDYDAALTILDSIPEDDPLYATALYRRATVLEKQGQRTDAIKALEMCILRADSKSERGRKLIRRSKSAILKLDKARALVMEHAAALERDARRFKKNSHDRQRVMAVVASMRGAFGALEPENRDVQLKRQLRKRYQEFHALIIKNELAAARELIEPNIRKLAGDLVDGYLNIIAGMLRLARVSEKDIQIDEIVFRRAHRDAKVVGKYRINGRWEKADPMYWLMHKEQWYVGDDEQLKKFK